jgi:hypothetical protein
MVNYNNAKIYKLVNLDLGLTYYGSTCGELKRRLSEHKSDAKTRNISSKLLFEQGICKIYLVEEFPTENKMLLHQRERFYIENNECVNKCLPSRTKREWEVENYDKRTKQHKEWYENNRKEKLEKVKQYQLKNTVKIKEQRKMYLIKNKDKINQQQKLYYAKKKLEQSSQPN